MKPVAGMAFCIAALFPLIAVAQGFGGGFLQGWEAGGRSISEAGDREDRRRAAELEREALRLRIEQQKERLAREAAANEEARRRAEERAADERTADEFRRVVDVFVVEYPQYKPEVMRSRLVERAMAIAAKSKPGDFASMYDILLAGHAKVRAELAVEREQERVANIDRLERGAEIVRLTTRFAAYEKHEPLRQMLTHYLDEYAAQSKPGARDWKVVVESVHKNLVAKYPELFKFSRRKTM